MDREVVRREVYGAILGEIAFRMPDIRGDIQIHAEKLADAVMKRLEALDATVLERRSSGARVGEGEPFRLRQQRP